MVDASRWCRAVDSSNFGSASAQSIEQPLITRMVANDVKDTLEHSLIHHD
jgi:hypothetical protein